MSIISEQQRDEEYIKIIVEPIRSCKTYKPKFGHGKALNLAEFQSMYQADNFYSWFGLDNPHTNARWLILRGTIAGSPTSSTYEFCRQVLGYDLAGFFQRHSARLKQEVESVLEILLR